MKLKCISTGSSGNCYLLHADNGETLILDCGIGIKEIKKGLDWNIKDVVGVLCTHKHLDHSKSLDNFKKCQYRYLHPTRETITRRIMADSQFIRFHYRHWTGIGHIQTQMANLARYSDF